ncbi:TonB-dependent receptor plug domain-containing protein [Eikenella sp. Marseille-P7795]|uniref:TonB-dependent receptor plug domain-containing protein n=1 Tax=Eikenella sp. Marseille-P7795 TaxID=2866577 RepID=UPI00351D3F74
MKPQAFRPRLLVLLLSAAFAHMQAVADSAVAKNDGASPAAGELETIEIKGRSRDQRGADDVYRKNVSSVYAGREYLERYRTDAASDVFKGLNGVYNMNTRNAGSAITPNIRGISGKGRIPVTIDGTEQTVDVWMNNYGIADRNYVDPALFRSITVEKGPAMTRGVKSGVGGAVSIRTIEPADIIPEGKSWGVELKTEFSNNTAEQIQNFNDYLGKDYRTMPGNPTADGASGMLGGGVPFTGLNFYGSDADKPRQSSRFSEFKNDRNLLFSNAFKPMFQTASSPTATAAKVLISAASAA